MNLKNMPALFFLPIGMTANIPTATQPTRLPFYSLQVLQILKSRYFIPEGWPGGHEPESKIMSDGRIFYTWVSDQANSYTQYTFGASFPSRYLAAGVIVTEPYVPPTKPTPSFDLELFVPVCFLPWICWVFRPDHLFCHSWRKETKTPVPSAQDFH